MSLKRARRNLLMGGSLDGELRKLQDGELIERGVELCIECPLNGKYIPVIGNCVWGRIREDGQRSVGGIRLHGEPSDFWYEISGKCPYAKNIISKPTSGDLKGIACSYQVS